MDAHDEPRQWCECHKGRVRHTYDVWDGVFPHQELRKVCGRCLSALRRAGIVEGCKVTDAMDIPFRTIDDRMPPHAKAKGDAIGTVGASWYELHNVPVAFALAMRLRGYLVERGVEV